MGLVRTEEHGSVRHVVLDRAEKRNAMNQALLLELGDALREAAADADVHCVILRGEGPVFSAGVDLAELGQQAADGDEAALRPYRNVFLDVPNICEEMPKPVICEIHGVCVGGALEVALGCDLRVMAADARVGLPEVRLGLIPDVGGCSRLPAVVGVGRAKELILTGRMIDAREAERIGLANRVAPPDQLQQATRSLVEELLACSPFAIGRAKRVIDAAARPALSTTLELEVAAQEACIATLRAQQREAEPAAT